MGVLALPYATSIGGLVFAPIVIAIIAIWNAKACDLMMECKCACVGKESTFPTNLSSTYSKIAYAGAGNLGVVLTDFSIIVTLVGVCIAYQITFAQLLQEIPGISASTSLLCSIFTVLVVPLSTVPNVGVLAPVSGFGLVCLVTSVIAILVYGFLSSSSPMNTTDPSYVMDKTVPFWPQTLSDTTSFIGVATFCFGLCSLAFPVEESMLHKNEFGTAVFWALVFVWFVYVLFGDLGAMLYIHDSIGISDNILRNLPINSFAAVVVRLAMTGVRKLSNKSSVYIYLHIYREMVYLDST